MSGPVSNADPAPGPRCACRATSPYDCWAVRYDLPWPWDRSSINMDGGPCECACHDRFDCDEVEEDWL